MVVVVGGVGRVSADVPAARPGRLEKTASPQSETSEEDDGGGGEGGGGGRRRRHL